MTIKCVRVSIDGQSMDDGKLGWRGAARRRICLFQNT
jgi:hypothetical protein